MCFRNALPLLLCGLLAACTEQPATPDAGVPAALVDRCDGAEAAAASEECSLTPGAEREGYLNPLEDVDWYVLQVPEPLPPRALLTVRAAYRAPSTPVTLVVNLLEADGLTSLGSATDPRPRGAPGAAQLVARLQSAGRYFVVVSHDSGAEDPAADRRNPYLLSAVLASDPDLNEPNDQAPTAVTLPACGATGVGGALSTEGDVDRFSFDLAPCSGRTLLHLTVDGPASEVALRLAYSLEGPAGTVAIDHAANPYAAQHLATARLVTAGRYTLTVQGYRAPGELRASPGDPAFSYQAKLALLPDADQNEGTPGNDQPGTATEAAMSVGGPARTFTGRISWVGDVDLFEVPAPAGGGRLHWTLRWSQAAGRFEPLPSTQPREAEVYTEASAGDCRATCPNGSTETAAWCSRGQCLWQRRVEEPQADWGNFEGMLPLPAGGPVLVKVGYQGSAGADDREYTLTLQLLAQTADESEGAHGRDNAIVVDLPSAGTARLGHGRGQRGTPAPNGLEPLPRSPLDYDALDDTDWFEVRFTPIAPPPEAGDAGAAADHSLTLAWTIPPVSGQRDGERSHDVGMRLHFCEDAACTKIRTTSGFLGYSAGAAPVWYPVAGLVDGGFQAPRTYDFEQSTGSFALRAATCTCLDASFAAAGRFWVEVQAHNRASYADAPVELTMSVGTYPPTVTDDQGRSFRCPVPCQWVSKSVQQ